MAKNGHPENGTTQGRGWAQGSPAGNESGRASAPGPGGGDEMKKEERLSPRATRRLVYLLTVLFSVVFLYAGNRLAAAGGGYLPSLTGRELLRARVTAVTGREISETEGIVEAVSYTHLSLVNVWSCK